MEENNTRAGRARRQYCWWITFAFPYAATVAALGLATPDDLAVDDKAGRQRFLDIALQMCAVAPIIVLEAAVFLERHRRTDDSGRRLPHLNCLIKLTE